MKRKTDFKKQTPEMLIGKEKKNTLYQKAFLDREEDHCGEFCQNTTTWD